LKKKGRNPPRGENIPRGPTRNTQGGELRYLRHRNFSVVQKPFLRGPFLRVSLWATGKRKRVLGPRLAKQFVGGGFGGSKVPKRPERGESRGPLNDSLLRTLNREDQGSGRAQVLTDPGKGYGTRVR